MGWWVGPDTCLEGGSGALCTFSHLHSGGCSLLREPLAPPLSLLLLQPVFPDGPGATLPLGI